jgi:hypothetical protein
MQPIIVFGRNMIDANNSDAIWILRDIIIPLATFSSNIWIYRSLSYRLWLYLLKQAGDAITRDCVLPRYSHSLIPEWRMCVWLNRLLKEEGDELVCNERRIEVVMGPFVHRIRLPITPYDCGSLDTFMYQEEEWTSRW